MVDVGVDVGVDVVHVAGLGIVFVFPLHVGVGVSVGVRVGWRSCWCQCWRWLVLVELVIGILVPVAVRV